jgi:hypothetical protein
MTDTTVNTTIQNNIRLFAQLGLEVTPAEARDLAQKVEQEIKGIDSIPTFDDIRDWLVEMRAVAHATARAKANMPMYAKRERQRLAVKDAIRDNVFTSFDEIAEALRLKKDGQPPYGGAHPGLGQPPYVVLKPKPVLIGGVKDD